MANLEELKTRRKARDHHISIDKLPDELRFRQLFTDSKALLDTLKMIAYRAETAMANSLREHLKRPDEELDPQRLIYRLPKPGPNGRTQITFRHWR